MTRYAIPVTRIAAMLAVVLVTVLASPAPASAAVPDFGINCNDAPTPQMPQSGVSGWIDPGPAVHDPAATSAYEKVGFPPPFSTYKQGNPATLCWDPSSSTNTMIANWIKGVATVLVAASISLHRLVTPPKFLDALDPLLVEASARMHSSIYVEYLGLALLIVAVGLLLVARRKDYASATSAVVWLLLVMGVATYLFEYPVSAGHGADDAVVAVTNNIDSNIGGVNLSASDPAGAQAEMLTNVVLYDNWLMGELGSSDSAVAKKYGPSLLYSQTFTYAEAAQIKAHPGQAEIRTMGKQLYFKKYAGLVCKEDASACQHLLGKRDRIGSSVVALVSAGAIVPFMCMADFLRVVALIIWRYGIIFSGLIALISIIPKFRKLGLAAVSAVSAGLVNACVFALGAAVDGLVVEVLFDPKTQLPTWAAVLLSAVTTIILWKAFKPFRRLTTMVSASSAVAGAQGGLGIGKMVRRGGKWAAGAAGNMAGVLAADAIDRKRHPEDHEPPPAERTESYTRPPETYRYSAPEPEAPAATREAPSVAHEPTVTAEVEVSGTQRGPDYGETTVGRPPVWAPAPSRPEVGTGQRQVEPDFPEQPAIYAPGESAHPERPMIEMHGEPVLVAGVETYRVWSSETQSYVDESVTDGEAS